MKMEATDVKLRLNELSRLKNGWLEGQGKALDTKGLDWLINTFPRLYPKDLPTPYIYPTIEGNVVLEWTLGTKEISLEIDLKVHKGKWDVLDVQTNYTEEKIINLAIENEWSFIGKRIREKMTAN